MDDKIDKPSITNLNPNPNPNPKCKANPIPSSNPTPTARRVFPVTKSPSNGSKLTIHNHREKPCRFILWTILFLIALIVLLVIASGILYLLCNPYRPNFSISSIKLVSLNLTNSSRLSSVLDLAVVAYNPNTRLTYLYDPISIAASYNGVQLGEAYFLGFMHDTKNVTTLRGTMEGILDNVSKSIATSAKKKRSLGLNIVMATKVESEVWGIKLRKIEAVISCGEVEVVNPNGGKAIHAAHLDSSMASCKVKFYIHLLNWGV